MESLLPDPTSHSIRDAVVAVDSTTKTNVLNYFDASAADCVVTTFKLPLL